MSYHSKKEKEKRLVDATLVQPIWLQNLGVWFSYWSNVIHLDVIDTYVQQNFWVFFMVDSTFFLICPVPYFHTVNSYSPSIYIIMHFFIIIHPESVCNFNLQLNSTWINMSISLQFKPNIFLSFFFLFFFFLLMRVFMWC